MTKVGQGQNKKRMWGKIWSFLMPFFILSTAPLMIYAQGTVTVAKPVDHRISDTFHVRAVHPATGKKNVPHWGTDFATPCGTPVPMKTGGNLICPNNGKPSGGAGIIGEVDHGCGIVEKFFHLQSCTTAGMVSGSTGVGTGCHLHHEVHIDNVKTNPERAYKESNLCDPAVKKRLIDEAKQDMNGMTGAGGGSGTSTGGQPKPPTQGGTTYVPPGGTNPYTGGVNTGGGYYVVEYEDGRIEIIADMGDGSSVTPTIPMGTPPDLVPTIEETSNELTGCATDTWAAMVNQAVLQTRREMVANELFITKPDSVMAYACITEHMENVSKYAGPIFSETKRWVNREVDILGKTVIVNKELGDTSLDGSIYNVAIAAYEEWMASYFHHDFLGGTMGGGESGGGEDHAHSEDQAYTPCGAMAIIWQAAKCKNADGDPLFYTFEQLIDNDPRQFPEGYQCNYTGIQQDHIDTAKGKKVKFDKVQMHYDLMYPEGFDCPAPIMTGVTVIRQKMEGDETVGTEEEYPDGLCIAVGCTYERSDEGGGQCVVK